MDQSARNLLYGLLIVIILVGAGSATFVIGLNIGRAESTAPITAQPIREGPTPAADSQATAAPSPTPDGDIRPELEILREAYDLIQSEYYGDVPDDTQLTYGAIRGMLQRLGDEHTGFLEPSIAQRERETRSGTYNGIGVLVDLNDSQKLEVVRVFRGSPAEAGGIRAGDQIVSVDGRSIVGLSLDEMIALVRGPAGTDVNLSIERPGADEPFDVVVMRAQIEIPLVEARMIGSDIAYVSLTSFDARATDQLAREIGSLLARNPNGLIFDLRSDPGGFLDQAIDVSDLFLDEGLVMIERNRDGSEQRFDSDSGDLAETIPLVVLVDRGSASASEIVAGAIQDRECGVLIGTLTFGKGSVQNVHTLSDGSELRVTIARWFTPNDRAIHGEGLEPNIVVEAGDDPAQDLQLDRAVEYLRTGK
ncbi:MAG: S41 family peptidase [Anaerolineae bacterium]